MKDRNSKNRFAGFESDKRRGLRRTPFIRRAFACLLAISMFLNILPMSLFEKAGLVSEMTAYASNKDLVPPDTVYSDENARVKSEYYNNGIYDLSNIDRILDYSRAYYSFPDEHQNDVIRLGYTGGASVGVITEFIGIGTEEVPFKGTVRLISSGGYNLQIPEAFFDYVYDSVQIIDDSSSAALPMEFERTTTNSEPVLAKHVKHDPALTSTLNWKVIINPYGGNNYSTSGFIGEMMEGAKLNLEIVDNTSMSIVNNASGNNDIKDAGYVCGKLGAGSSLTVSSITGSNTSYSITSAAGHAGGVVGSMQSGSTLTLGCKMKNTTASVTASGVNNYAGGIAGCNIGGTVVSGKDGSNNNVFSASNKYPIQNTVSGKAGAGGVFGYYRPSFTSNEASFDIAWLKIGTSTSSRMAANGKGYVGGLFGVLENEIATSTTTGEGNEAVTTTTYSSGKITITDSSDNTAVVYVDHTDGDMTGYGGIVGKYGACDLAGTLLVNNVSVNIARSGGTYSCYGGGIGETVGIRGNSTANGVYVKFDDFQATAASGNKTSASVYGGLVALSYNSFIDANVVKASSNDNFYGGGVIGRMEDGVLRFSGTTDLTGGHALISSDNFRNEGQIVGGRDNSVIFAEKDWILKRSSACSVDNIGSWGEVLRFTGINTTETNGVVTATEERYGTNTVLTVDETAHTVEVASHTVSNVATTISSEADFAKIAFCFQINAAENPCLAFNSGWGSVDYDDINSTDITLGADINLSGTGLTGFTRDNQTGTDTTYCVYSGKFDGGNKKITLAIGEPYGKRGDSNLTDHSAEGSGKIYRHVYNGLFGIVDGDYSTTNYTVKDLTLTGTVDVGAKKVGDQLTLIYCGAYAARALQNFTASNVKTEASTAGSETTTGLRMTQAGDCKLYMGRLVGEMDSDIELITIADSEFGGSISGTNSDGASCFGGVIGRISHNKDEDRTWNFSSVTLQGTVENTTSKAVQRIGGLIAEIDGSYNGNSNHRTLNLIDVTVNGLTVSGPVSADGSMGGLLGYDWNKVDVNANSITVQDNSTDSTKSTVNIGSAAGHTAGLVYRATGHWKVTSIDIKNIKMTASGASSVGMLVNKGYTYSGNNVNFYTAGNSSAIYLELPASYTYNLALDSSSSINSSAVFDELCAYTCPSSSDIMKNGNGVISINTTFYTDGTNASGTYHAQTSYGAKPNPNSRYYYNLDAMDSVGTPSDTSDPAKLMMWGLNRYACKNLKQYFSNYFSDGSIENSPGNTFDMMGYSWYPVNLDSGITLNGTFKLYNKEFEGSEKKKYENESSNAYKRTSLYDSTNGQNTQHYMMHNALLNDVNSSTLTIGTVVLQGDVAGYAESGSNASVCGALVCGTVSGSSTGTVASVKVSDSGSISLDGIKVYNVGEDVGNALEVSGYAPLLINKVGSHSSLNLSNISTTTAYNGTNTSDTAATSLIGDVGSSTATDINVDFKLITLDGRNATGKADTDLSAAAKGNFNAMYHTYNSIFSKATLLNKFSFDSGSSGRYDFTWEQDWDANNDEIADTAHAGHVTYGKELGYDSTNYPKTGAVSPKYNSQYPDEEFKYLESAKYTNPITAAEGENTHAYATKFLTNFIPYVAEKYEASNKKYQLQVNHGKVDTTGCGTYNHPYIISSGDDIEKFSEWIISNAVTNAKIRIPISGLVYDGTDSHKITAITGTWCSDQLQDALCTYSSENNRFESTEASFVKVDGAAILAAVDPSERGWFVSDGGGYTAATDTTAQSGMTYYARSFEAVTPSGSKNPSEEGWYESDGADPAVYTLTADTTVDAGKTYYSATYAAVKVSDHIDPKEQNWYEQSGTNPDYIYIKTEDTAIDTEKTYYKGETVYFDAEVLRTYLAGAYYKIDPRANANDLVIDDEDFIGFGASDNAAYRFRGLFDGSGKTVTNTTGSPFIYYSNGCVVKDLTISVQPDADILLVGFQKSFDELYSDKSAKGNAAYGAVIARVMGGDNIIDNVTVSYANMAHKFNMRAIFAQLVPLGGYVGVVVNGGVVFRNMATAAAAYAGGENPVGLNNSLIEQDVATEYPDIGTKLVDGGTYTSDTNTNNFLASNAWLYINPYVGRVINGYAVNESSAYRPFENGERQYDGEKDTDTAVTLQNGSKHYSITDIATSDTIAVDENTVTANSGQDLFLMSLMINSGMSKKALGFNQAYQVSRSASYEYVGTNTKTDYDSDAVYDVLDSSIDYKSVKYGYLATKFASTQPTNGFAGNANLIIVLSANAVLPDGFKGFGNLFQANDNYRIKINTFNGGGYTVSQNTSYYYYDSDIAAYSPQTTTAGGLGLINYVSVAGTYKNMYLKGMVKTDLINTNDGKFLTSKKPSDLDAAKYLCAGMLIGTAGAGITVKDLALTNIDVFGLRNSGGLIGFETADTLTYTIETTDKSLYNSDKIKVHGRASTGGMLGKINTGYVKVDMNGHTFNLSEVVCENENERGGNYYDFGVGGFVGMMRKGDNSVDDSDAESSNYFKNIVIGTKDKAQVVKCEGTEIFTAGVVGIMNKCKGITIENCDFYNLSVNAKFAAAGLVAFPTSYTPAKVTDTHLYSPLGSEIKSTTDFAGGLIGSSDPRNGVGDGSREFTFDNCSVSGYTISGKKGAGGVIGFRGAAETNHPLYIKNIKVSDCTVKSDGALGGLIGEMNNSVVGYNILATDILFDTYTDLEENQDPPATYKSGYICGSINIKSENLVYKDKDGKDVTSGRTNEDISIKLAGFSRQDSKSPNTMIETLIGANNAGGTYGTDGYVVFADYNDKATSAPNAEFANVYSSNNVPMADEVVGKDPNGSKTTTSKYKVAVDSGSTVSINGVEPYEVPVVTESEEVAESEEPSYSAGKKVGYVVNDQAVATAVDNVNKLAGYGDTVDGKITNGFYIYCVGTDNTNDKRKKKRYGYLTENIVIYDNDGNVVSSGGNGNVIQQTTSISNACVFYFDKEVKTLSGVDYDVYHIYKIVMEGEGDERHPVKYYIHVSGTHGQTKYVEFSPTQKDDLIIDGLGTTIANGNTEYKFSFCLFNEDRYFLSHSDGGGGIRYFGKQDLNNNGKFVIKAIPDDKILQAIDYGTVTKDSSGNLTFSSPSAARNLTESEASDFETLCNNREDKELYYVTEAVSENNPFVQRSNIQPFVTTSPKLNIDNDQFLTGDGVGYEGSITYANSAIGKILTDASGTSEAKRYSFAKDSVGTSATADLIAKLNTYGRLSSYKTEMGANAMTSKDFPVIIVDEVECTDYINELLQYMTNTDFDFAAGNDSVFNIEIGSMIWDEEEAQFHYTNGAYSATTNPNGAYLENNTLNGKFSIDGSKFDNTEVGRFTLLDVQFYDPGDTGSSKKIAYHLYVPILVKKMLLYDFYASTLSGTNYRIPSYDAARDNTLIENAGNPVSMEIQWRYHRTLEEWRMALESGDNFLMTLDKELRLRIPTNTFPTGTKMVLVDPNDDNKHYYATDATSGLIVADNGSTVNYTFDLSKFSDTLTGSPAFNSVFFNDFFDFTVTQNSSGNGGYDKVILYEGVSETVEHYIEAGATMRVEKSGGGYDYFKPAQNGGYDITMAYKEGASDPSTGYLTENYYISFFTDIDAPERDGKDLYHLDFYDRETFGNDSLPTKAVLKQHTHILTGNIFVNEFSIDPKTDDPRMTASNDTLEAELKATVGINEDLRNDVKAYLSPTNTTVSVYQSMLIMLNRIDEDSQEKGILAKPGISVSDFTIKHSITTGEGEGAVTTVYTDESDCTTGMSPFNDDTLTANYIEIRDNINLRDYLYKSCYENYNLDIKATVNLTYSNSESMSAQFPTRDSSNIDDDTIGTVIGGSSNISSVKTAAAYSKTSTPFWTNKAYYCTINTNAILTLNSNDAANVFGDYYQLGINELDMEADNLPIDEDGNTQMKLNATYNVSNLTAAGNAKSMKLVISVRKKADYGVKLDIDDYIKDLVLYDGDNTSFKANSTLISCTETPNAVEYTYIVKDPETTLNFDSEGHLYQIPITFTAYSGANFNKQYSNYMIHLKVELYKDYAAAEEYIEGSRDEDHVIWTNAKIVYSVFE